jgi:foldase protein PrsA
LKKIKSIIALITLVIFVFGLSGCGLITKTENGTKKTAIATVNGKKITLGDYQDRLNQQTAQYEAMQPGFFTQNPTYLTQIKQQVYTQMLQEEVIMQKAEELDLVISDKDLDAAVDQQLKSDIKTAGGEKKFEETLKTNNKTKEEYTDAVRASLKQSKTIMNVYNNITKSAGVSEKNILAEYKANPYKYTEKPDTMNVSHILVKSASDVQGSITPARYIVLKAQAEKILKEIKSGKMTFEAAAKKYGTDGTKDKGGLLGDIEYTTTEYDADFVKGAIATKTGAVSEPVKTQFGYHLIKINSRKEYKIKPLSAVKAEIKATLLETDKKNLFNTAFTTWYSVAKIEEFQDNIK